MKKGFYFLAGALTVVGCAVLAYKGLQKLAGDDCFCDDDDCCCGHDCNSGCDEHKCACEAADKAVPPESVEVEAEPDAPVEEIEKVVEDIPAEPVEIKIEE